MVQWPNGVTIDFFAERLYWVDAKNDYIASADLDGKNVKKIIEGTVIISAVSPAAYAFILHVGRIDDFSLMDPQGQTLHPFAVAIFKGVMYWDDWNAQGIFMADKNRGTGLSTLVTQLPGVMDLKVFIVLLSFYFAEFRAKWCCCSRSFRKACAMEAMPALTLHPIRARFCARAVPIKDAPAFVRME